MRINRKPCSLLLALALTTQESDHLTSSSVLFCHVFTENHAHGAIVLICAWLPIGNMLPSASLLPWLLPTNDQLLHTKALTPWVRNRSSQIKRWGYMSAKSEQWVITAVRNRCYQSRIRERSSRFHPSTDWRWEVERRGKEDIKRIEKQRMLLVSVATSLKRYMEKARNYRHLHGEATKWVR